MPFPDDCYDPETLGLMTKAFAAWDEVGFALASKDDNPTALRTLIAVRIMAAVRDGEHNPEGLEYLALEAIARPPGRLIGVRVSTRADETER